MVIRNIVKYGDNKEILPVACNSLLTAGGFAVERGGTLPAAAPLSFVVGSIFH